MNKSIAMLVACSTIVSMAVAAPAGPAVVAVPAGAHANADAVAEGVGTSHKLITTLVGHGQGPLSVPGYIFVDFGNPATINCTNADGCTVTVDMKAQLAAQASELHAAVCFSVDGLDVACPWQQIIRPGANFQTVGYEDFATVTPGSHTIVTKVFSDVDTTMYFFSKKIQLFKP
jgi:hypothetical protein